MATLPSDYARRQAPQDRGQFVPAYGGSATGEAIQGVAGQLGKLADEYQHNQNVAAISTARRALDDWERTALFDPEQGAINKRGKDAEGVPQQLQTSFDDAANRAMEGLTAGQRRAFQEVANGRRGQVLDWAAKHAGNEREKFQEGAYKADVQSFIDRASLFPDKADTELSLMKARVANYLGSRGASAEEIKATAEGFDRHARERLDKEAYERNALLFENGTDPRGSTDWKLMDPGHKAIMMGRIRAEQDRNAALALAQQEHAQHVAEKAIDGARDFATAGGLMDRAYEDSVRRAAAAAGPAYKAQADAWIKLSQQSAGYGSQPLVQQQATLRDLEVKAQTQGSSPEEMKRIQFLRGITDKQENEYKENPWAATQRFGRLGVQAPVMNITAPEQGPALVAERVKQISAVETMAGRPVSPLQPDEAAAMVDVLKKADPAAQSRALAGMSAPLGLGQIEALSSQLDKGSKPMALAMKLGSLNTNAGRLVSELVLRGAAGIADKTIKKDDAALTGWRAAISEKVRGTLGSDQAEKDVIEASYYVRAAQEMEGIAAPGFSKGIGSGEDDAIAMVIGTPVVRAGVKTILPRGMKESDFDDRLVAQAPAQGQALVPSGKVYLRGREIDFKTGVLPLIGSMGLQRDERGRYIPVNRGAMVTLDPGGTIPLAIQVQ